MVHTSALSDSYYLVTQAHVSFMSCLLGKNFNFSLHFVFSYWDYASLSHLLKSFTSHYVFFSLDKGLGEWARPNTYTPVTSLPVSPRGKSVPSKPTYQNLKTRGLKEVRLSSLSVFYVVRISLMGTREGDTEHSTTLLIPILLM